MLCAGAVGGASRDIPAPTPTTVKVRHWSPDIARLQLVDGLDQLLLPAAGIRGVRRRERGRGVVQSLDQQVRGVVGEVEALLRGEGVAVRVEGGGVNLGAEQPGEQPPVEAHVPPRQGDEDGGHQGDHVHLRRAPLVDILSAGDALSNLYTRHKTNICRKVVVKLQGCLITCCWKAPLHNNSVNLSRARSRTRCGGAAAAWRKTALMYGLVHFHISLQLPEPGHGVAILYFVINRVYRSATNELFFPAPSKN